jgi:hypothetical protein
MTFNTRTTDHGRGRLSYCGSADIFGVYFPPTKDVYLVPLEAVAPTAGWLRLDPPRNNQKKRIRMASDFEIGRWSAESLHDVLVGATPSSRLTANVA